MKRSTSREGEPIIPLYLVLDGSEGILLEDYGNGNNWYTRWRISRSPKGRVSMRKVPTGKGYPGTPRNQYYDGQMWGDLADED